MVYDSNDPIILSFTLYELFGIFPYTDNNHSINLILDSMRRRFENPLIVSIHSFYKHVRNSMSTREKKIVWREEMRKKIQTHTTHTKWKW